MPKSKVLQPIPMHAVLVESGKDGLPVIVPVGTEMPKIGDVITYTLAKEGHGIYSPAPTPAAKA